MPLVPPPLEGVSSGFAVPLESSVLAGSSCGRAAGRVGALGGSGQGEGGAAEAWASPFRRGRRRRCRHYP